MSAVTRIRSRRSTFAETPRVSASTAKNSFGRILDRVAREGRLAITKHDQPCAMLISIEEYRVLAAAEQVTLDTLSEEFDALFERMQEPGAAAAMQRAFALTPAQLGRAAVKDVALAPGRRGHPVEVSAAKPAKRDRSAIKGAPPASAKDGPAAVKGARRARG